jgi:origin recognition complex subunit 4
MNEEQEEEDGPLTNTVASQQLSDLLIGTVTRGEGNSCLLLGPRGSGKTRVRSDFFIPHPIIV